MTEETLTVSSAINASSCLSAVLYMDHKCTAQSKLRMHRSGVRLFKEPNEANPEARNSEDGSAQARGVTRLR